MDPPSSSASVGVAQLNPAFLHVSEVQRGNPLLAHIKNVKWAFTKEIIPDYVMGSTCALFLSLKYHFRHPKHIVRRIDEVGRNYRLRVLLVFVDDETNLTPLQELNRIAFTTNFTLICAWSNLECARYLETFKSYENKSPASIQAKEETEFLPRLTRVLTSVRSVNKSDVATLLDVFGNFSGICAAQEQQLVLCPGLGEKKVKRLFQALHEPFVANPSQKMARVSDLFGGSRKKQEKAVEPAKETDRPQQNEGAVESSAAAPTLDENREVNEANTSSKGRESSSKSSRAKDNEPAIPEPAKTAQTKIIDLAVKSAETDDDEQGKEDDDDDDDCFYQPLTAQFVTSRRKSSTTS